MNPRLWFLPLILAALTFPATRASAQFFNGPASSATGGSGRAAIDQGEVPFLNPAGVAFLQRYNASAYYGVGQHPRDSDYNVWGIGLADGTPGNIVSGSASYFRKRSDYPGGRSDTQQDLQIGLAGFPVQRFALGIAGHRLTDQVLFSPAAGAEYIQTNGHVGFIVVPTAQMGIAFVAYDVLPTSDSVPETYRLIPTHAIGINYLYEKSFRFRFDLVRPDVRNPGRRTDVQTGIESFLVESWVFRVGGYWRETADQTFATVGLGYIGPRLSFDYSFQKDVREGDNNRHMIDLWLGI